MSVDKRLSLYVLIVVFIANKLYIQNGKRHQCINRLTLLSSLGMSKMNFANRELRLIIKGVNYILLGLCAFAICTKTNKNLTFLIKCINKGKG